MKIILKNILFIFGYILLGFLSISILLILIILFDGFLCKVFHNQCADGYFFIFCIFIFICFIFGLAIKEMIREIGGKINECIKNRKE